MIVLDNEATNALLFNKGMLNDYSLENPYELVKNGTWTMDKLEEMVRNVSVDLNSDGKINKSFVQKNH